MQLAVMVVGNADQSENDEANPEVDLCVVNTQNNICLEIVASPTERKPWGNRCGVILALKGIVINIWFIKGANKTELTRMMLFRYSFVSAAQIKYHLLKRQLLGSW